MSVRGARWASAGGKLKKAPVSCILRNEDFGYWTITVKRPLRDAADAVVPAQKGKLKGELQADAALHGKENVPLSADVQVYFERQVPQLVPDAWIDCDKTKVGYEIPFNRYF